MYLTLIEEQDRLKKSVKKSIKTRNIVLEVLIPILLIIGYKTRILGSIMCLFTLTVALIFHLDFDSQIKLIMLLINLNLYTFDLQKLI